MKEKCFNDSVLCYTSHKKLMTAVLLNLKAKSQSKALTINQLFPAHLAHHNFTVVFCLKLLYLSLQDNGITKEPDSCAGKYDIFFFMTNRCHFKNNVDSCSSGCFFTRRSFC